MGFQDLMTAQVEKRTSLRSSGFRSKLVKCEVCGQTIISRTDDGIWYFRYGRAKNLDGKFIGTVPVEIYIYGSIKIKCLRKECGHWSTLNFFPFDFFDINQKEKLEVPKK